MISLLGKTHLNPAAGNQSCGGMEIGQHKIMMKWTYILLHTSCFLVPTYKESCGKWREKCNTAEIALLRFFFTWAGFFWFLLAQKCSYLDNIMLHKYVTGADTGVRRQGFITCFCTGCSLNIVFFLKILWFFWTLSVLMLQRWYIIYQTFRRCLSGWHYNFLRSSDLHAATFF